MYYENLLNNYIENNPTAKFNQESSTSLTCMHPKEVFEKNSTNFVWACDTNNVTMYFFLSRTWDWPSSVLGPSV